MNGGLPVTVVALILSGPACRVMWVESGRTPNYIVTTEPISVHAGPGGLCFAIDPADPVGLWWWGPGRSGCSTRNTRAESPEAVGLAALFHPTDAAVVSPANADETEARFRLGLTGPPDFVDVDLTVRGGRMRCASTGAEVGTKRTNKIDIPLLAPYGFSPGIR